MSFRRYTALAGVLVGGVCAALPFQKSLPSAEEIPRPHQVDQPPAVAPAIAIESQGPANEVSPASKLSSLAAPFEEWSEPTPLPLPGDGDPIPMLPRLPVVRRVSRDSLARIHEPDFSASETAALPTPDPVPASPPMRRHRIRDGDTLERIALRYLGDERRAEAISRLNVGVIQDPNLLPIGKEIMIPQE